VVIVTDGDRNSPEVEYFFAHAPLLEGWATMHYHPGCLDGANATTAGCDVLFFPRTSISSVDAFNLLACVPSSLASATLSVG
jgi:hypothetical protein